MHVYICLPAARAFAARCYYTGCIVPKIGSGGRTPFACPPPPVGQTASSCLEYRPPPRSATVESSARQSVPLMQPFAGLLTMHPWPPLTKGSRFITPSASDRQKKYLKKFVFLAQVYAGIFL